MVDPVKVNSTIRLADIRTAFYRLQTNLGQGNIFTSVCHSFCPRRGGVGWVSVGLPTCITGQMTRVYASRGSASRGRLHPGGLHPGGSASGGGLHPGVLGRTPQHYILVVFTC